MSQSSVIQQPLPPWGPQHPACGVSGNTAKVRGRMETEESLGSPRSCEDTLEARSEAWGHGDHPHLGPSLSFSSTEQERAFLTFWEGTREVLGRHKLQRPCNMWVSLVLPLLYSLSILSCSHTSLCPDPWTHHTSSCHRTFALDVSLAWNFLYHLLQACSNVTTFVRYFWQPCHSLFSFLLNLFPQHLLPSLKHTYSWTSLVEQWLRIHLPMQGTRVRFLVWEDLTCCRATKLVRHNYWACTLEPTSHNYWAHVPQLLKPAHLEPTLRNKRSHCNEKPAHDNEE